MPLRVIGVVFLLVAAAAGAGWATGASARSAMERDLHRADMRATYAEARAQLLDGRVSLYLTNFGDAVERFQAARTLIGRLQRDLREQGLVDQAGRLEIALSHTADAQRATTTFETAEAQVAAEQALDALQAAGEGR